MIGIYKITSPSGRVYIGQTINFQRRISEYRRLSCKGQTRLYNSFLKYGFEKHSIILIEICYENELNNRERYYQELFNTISKSGLNCQYVKTDSKKYKHSEETKLKISNSNKGKNTRSGFSLTESHKIKIGLSNKGNKRPDVSKRISLLNSKNKGSNNNFFGKTHSKNSIDKISKSRKGKNKGFNNSKSVIVLNTQTGIYYTFSDLETLLNRSIKSKVKFYRLSKKITHDFLIV